MLAYYRKRMRELEAENEKLKKVVDSQQAEIKKIVSVLSKLTYDLRTNMTSVTRYIRHEKGIADFKIFRERNIKYKKLANNAVDNILKCLNDNDELRAIEAMRNKKDVFRNEL